MRRGIDVGALSGYAVAGALAAGVAVALGQDPIQTTSWVGPRGRARVGSDGALVMGGLLAGATVLASRALSRRTAWARALHEALRPSVRDAGGVTIACMAISSGVGEELPFFAARSSRSSASWRRRWASALLHQMRGPSRWVWAARCLNPARRSAHLVQEPKAHRRRHDADERDEEPAKRVPPTPAGSRSRAWRSRAASGRSFFAGSSCSWRGRASSVGFGLLHQMRGPSRWVWAAWAGAMGLLFALVFVVTGSLVGAVLAHVAINGANLLYIRDVRPKRPLNARSGAMPPGAVLPRCRAGGKLASENTGPTRSLPRPPSTTPRTTPASSTDREGDDAPGPPRATPSRGSPRTAS